MKDSTAGDGQTAVPVVEHQASIPFDSIASTIQVSTDATFGTTLELEMLTSASTGVLTAVAFSYT